MNPLPPWRAPPPQTPTQELVEASTTLDNLLSLYDMTSDVTDPIRVALVAIEREIANRRAWNAGAYAAWQARQCGAESDP